MKYRAIILLVYRFIRQSIASIRLPCCFATMSVFLITIYCPAIKARESDSILKPSELDYTYSPDEINLIKQRYNDLSKIKVFVGCIPKEGCYDDKEWLKIRYVRGSPSEYAEPIIFLRYRSTKGTVYDDIISTKRNFELFENVIEPKFVVKFDLIDNHLSIIATPLGFVHHLSEKIHSRF